MFLQGSSSLRGWATAFAVFDANGKWQLHTSEIDFTNIASGLLECPILLKTVKETFEAKLMVGQLYYDMSFTHDLIGI